MLKRILVFVLVCILVFPLILEAKERRGADLEVVKKEGQRVRGELITIKDCSLLILDTQGKDITVHFRDIRVITVLKKSKFWLGAGIGFLTVAAYTIYDISDEGFALKGYISYPVMFGSIGAIIGGLIGVALSIDKTIQIEGQSEEKIKVIMNDLRKKARVPDYQ